jgi:Zn finger protein HypA/HybF involved in hydrogenase expression|tara:strand:- start:54 stop:194 length:141 start_codon:yes stop_codon:yes gene_type:complete
MIIVNVQCDECQATCTIEHELETDVYKVTTCPFCHSDAIDIDEEVD